MEYISTDFEKSDIKHGTLTESPLRGSTARYVCNPIVDDIEAAPGPEEQYLPPSCLVVGDPSINDLASWRWQGRTVDAETERELIRRIQEGDPRCRAGLSRGCGCRSCRAFFDPRPGTISLLPAFHHSIRKIAGGYVPKGSQRRKYKKASHSLIFQDLMAVGCFGLWKAALAFDFDKRFRLWTIAQPKTDGLISNEANYLRRNGMGGGKRVERWLFSHLGDTPEELLAAQKELKLKRPVFHSLEEAAAAIKAASAVQYCDVYLDDGEDGGGDVREIGATEPSWEFRALYDSYNPERAANTNQDDDVELRIGPIIAFGETRYCERSPDRGAVKTNSDRGSLFQLTGRVLHPIDKRYWMEPRDERPKERAGKRYDPDRREVAVIPLKSGKTKRVYRQMAADPGRHIQVNEAKGKQNHVRPNRKQAIGSPIAEIVVFQSRGSSVEGLHLG